MKRKWIIIAAAIAVAVVAVVLIVCLCGRNESHALPAEEAAEEETVEEETVELLFGIDKQRYDIEQGIVREGETAGQILARYGVGAGTVDRIAKAAEPVFSLKNIRFGKPFTVFREKDSTSRLAYFVYEPTATDYLIVDLSGDSVDVRKNAKEVTVERRMKTATIESSLWNCMIDNGMSPNLAMELSEIYAWSIDSSACKRATISRSFTTSSSSTRPRWATARSGAPVSSTEARHTMPFRSCRTAN